MPRADISGFLKKQVVAIHLHMKICYLDYGASISMGPNHSQLDDDNSPIPFTARLTAFHRALENQEDSPLIIDPLAEELAGDMSEYVKKHKFTSLRRDYTVVRTYFVENELLGPWCIEHSKSQIVMMGAGLDTRAYRFKPLTQGSHTVFEIDLDPVISYKTELLKNAKPICDLIQISADLSKSDWNEKLIEAGFSRKLPTFWIFEGLLYYLEKGTSISILQEASNMSLMKNKIFSDICVPILAEVKFGPFMKHFRWGLHYGAVPAYFSDAGWDVSHDWADSYACGRDVGQKGMIFAYGYKSD